ncbi:MAG TPA: hypothetical protein VF848_11275 [Steroidobacteraceae bacterium]
MKTQAKPNVIRSFVVNQKRSIGAVLLILALSVVATGAMAASILTSV